VKRKYRNTAFLLEMMINILVFAISCAVLVGLFGKAWQISRKTRMETGAAGEVMSLVETVKLRGAAAIPYADNRSPGELVCYYNSRWQPLAAAQLPPVDAAFKISLTVITTQTPAGLLSEVQALAETTDGEELYRMATASYTPQEGGAAA
jgi:type II secretory pathway pseudopilin PulG